MHLVRTRLRTATFLAHISSDSQSRRTGSDPDSTGRPHVPPYLFTERPQPSAQILRSERHTHPSNFRHLRETAAGTPRARVLVRARRPGGTPGARPRIHSTKGGWGSGQKTSCGSVACFQANRPRARKDAEGRLRRGRRGEGRGRRGREIVSTARGESTRRRKSPGGARTSSGLDRLERAPHSPRGARPWSRGRRCWRGSNRRWRRPNGKRATAGESRRGSARGTNPWRANPGRGSGAKQTRKAGGGANRRGRAKRRGRNVARAGRSGGEWMPPVEVAKRDETPWEAPFRREVGRRVASRRTLKETSLEGG